MERRATGGAMFFCAKCKHVAMEKPSQDKALNVLLQLLLVKCRELSWYPSTSHGRGIFCYLQFVRDLRASKTRATPSDNETTERWKHGQRRVEWKQNVSTAHIVVKGNINAFFFLKIKQNGTSSIFFRLITQCNVPFITNGWVLVTEL